MRNRQAAEKRAECVSRVEGGVIQRGGKAVRLLQGDYDRETVYGDDPVALAESFVIRSDPVKPVFHELAA